MTARLAELSPPNLNTDRETRTKGAEESLTLWVCHTVRQRVVLFDAGGGY